MRIGGFFAPEMLKMYLYNEKVMQIFGDNEKFMYLCIVFKKHV